MKECIVVCIWDKGDEVFTRSIEVNGKTKELKMNGKKPNKMIVPESVIDKVLLRRIKSIGSYDCQIIKAKGK